jgi:hypothetical protein
MSAQQPITFASIVDKFESNLWGFHLTVPESIARSLIDKGNRRVVCILEDKVTLQCALMPKGDGSFFINLNKALRDKLKLKVGSTVRVSLREDDSQYGLPMPEELEELLKIDDEGNRLFHALSPGRQRSLLYIVGSVKRSETRITRALAVVEHLKLNGGKLDFKVLYESMKGGGV